MDLSTLLDRCRGGDELAWEALVRRFQARIYGIAYHYVWNAEDARDLSQEVFLRIYRNLSLCPDGERFFPWIIRITRNLCIDHLRRKKARPAMHHLDAAEIQTLRAAGNDPDQTYSEESKRSLIHCALQEMTALNREIILLKDIQGLTLEDIATMLHVPVGTVKSRSNRARIELAHKLAFLRSEPAGGPAV
jgi:RNA polymerase sigma-70 factor (ECF subfamily)